MTKPRQGKGKIGSRFDDFLREEGIYAHTQAVVLEISVRRRSVW